MKKKLIYSYIFILFAANDVKMNDLRATFV